MLLVVVLLHLWLVLRPGCHWLSMADDLSLKNSTLKNHAKGTDRT